MARRRGFDSPESLLRMLLLHVADGYSLCEAVVRAKAEGIAEVLDVALLKRLRTSETWLRGLRWSLLRELKVALPRPPGAGKFRLVDATTVQQPGPTGSEGRLHYSLQFPSLVCDFLELTPSEGEGSGNRFPAS